MTQGPQDPASPTRERPDRPTFFEWFPWEKLTIWALFLGAVYLVRHFFFVIFMTFIVAYNMRAVVVRFLNVLSPNKERVWLERILALFCFAALLGACYGVGRYFVPHLTEQGEKLVAKVGRMVENPQDKLDEVLSDTVGRWLLRDQLGGPGDEAFDAAFEAFQQSGLRPVEHAKFKSLVRELEEEFEAHLTSELTAEAMDAIANAGETNARLVDFVLSQESDAVLAATKALHEADRRVNRPFDLPDDPSWDQLEKPEQASKLRSYVSDVLLADREKRAPLEAAWRTSLGKSLVAALRANDPARYEQQFKERYEALRSSEPQRLPHEYDRFVELRATLSQDEEGAAFARALDGLANEAEISDDQRTEKLREEFERERRFALVAEWKKGDLARKIGGKVEETVASGLTSFTATISKRVQGLVMLPLELALSLLLSLFITFDFCKIRRGVLRLKTSRAANFYEEIAPGLYSFGRLIGRAFQAQAVIALFNTLLTFIAVQLLGIQNSAFLCAIVFVCSFIPVLGVVLSSVPIAIMAIIQENGGVMLALWAIGAILLIHFIETSILNPKILGDMLHLHPVMVLAILAIGEHFVGVWGLLLGVPVIVYVIRFVILDEGIPGIIDIVRSESSTKGRGLGARPASPALASTGAPPQPAPGPPQTVDS